MFEDAVIESAGKIHTQRGWLSGVAAICNGAIVGVLLLWPLLHPASLPRQTLSMLLAAPAPPVAPTPHMARVANVATHAAALVNPFAMPSQIPKHIADAQDAVPPMPDDASPLFSRDKAGAFEGLAHSMGTAAPPAVHVTPEKKPVISAGVMAGNKISGALPQYPVIAREVRIQGTVVLGAIISRTGTIENLQVISGPPMLVPAAEEAVRTWRYRPYLLNGEPVEVETTIHVVFNLGG